MQLERRIGFIFVFDEQRLEQEFSGLLYGISCLLPEDEPDMNNRLIENLDIQAGYQPETTELPKHYVIPLILTGYHINFLPKYLVVLIHTLTLISYIFIAYFCYVYAQAFVNTQVQGSETFKKIAYITIIAQDCIAFVVFLYVKYAFIRYWNKLQQFGVTITKNKHVHSLWIFPWMAVISFSVSYVWGSQVFPFFGTLELVLCLVGFISDILLDSFLWCVLWVPLAIYAMSVRSLIVELTQGVKYKLFEADQVLNRLLYISQYLQATNCMFSHATGLIVLSRVVDSFDSLIQLLVKTDMPNAMNFASDILVVISFMTPILIVNFSIEQLRSAIIRRIYLCDGVEDAHKWLTLNVLEKDDHFVLTLLGVNIQISMFKGIVISVVSSSMVILQALISSKLSDGI
eukprot:TRINITY_DN3320_c0_g1_i1.p1 TRINITY_DN3320_c0_g1~~TRINITY_DN3320_c0_g1_i1.p1  ORF type:complete len:402 (-),score=35.82 TRINITY_DN3320_c0_g1_i1:101-1306(-)